MRQDRTRCGAAGGRVLADRPIVHWERILGRGAAFCVHPALAWRRLPPNRRALIVAAYFGAGYVSVLTALLLF